MEKLGVLFCMHSVQSMRVRDELRVLFQPVLDRTFEVYIPEIK